MKFCIIIYSITLTLVLSSCQKKADTISHTISTTKKPWTHLNFKNDPDEFQFAIVSDNTGGARKGIFNSAVDKLNTIQPEFVLSVGDYIEGYTSDMSTVNKQWNDFTDMTSKFEMPFFYLPGNHDNTNPEMASVYEHKFGVRYYSFIYKNTLFICLDTQEKANAEKTDVINNAGLMPEQIEWVKSTLAANPDVRWTFVLMHQPLWLYDAKEPQGNSKHKVYGQNTGFAEVEKALGSRKFTVVAGHFHRYTKFIRNNRNYYVLSTTGGGSKLRGTGYGEFDHAAWITMTKHGPKLANMLLDGIQRDDVYTERTGTFTSSVKINYTSDPQSPNTFTGTLSLNNPFDHDLLIEEEWSNPKGSGWTLKTDIQKTHLHPGEKREFNITLTAAKNANLQSAPTGTLKCSAGSEYNGTIKLTSPLRAFAKVRKPKLKLKTTKQKLVLDGILNEKLWKEGAIIHSLNKLDLTGTSNHKATLKLAYDKTHLYLAGEFFQDPQTLKTKSIESSDPLWTDDGVELFFDLNNDFSTYSQALITANNVMNQIHIKGIESATARTKSSWTLEVSIPLKELNIEGDATGKKIGFNLRRNLPEAHGINQSEWSPTISSYPHNIDLLGTLLF